MNNNNKEIKLDNKNDLIKNNNNIKIENDTEKEECPICLDYFFPGKAIFIAECGHKFHFTCILENINHDEINSDKCPICRKEQKEWPENTSGLSKSHPYCTNCGRRGTGGLYCEHCGNSLSHSPRIEDRDRIAVTIAQNTNDNNTSSTTTANNNNNNIIVDCPTCRIRCIVNMTIQGTLQCPNGHLFQVRLQNSTNSNNNLNDTTFQRSELNIRQCPTCSIRVHMPNGSQTGQYMCPHGHMFYYRA